MLSAAREDRKIWEREALLYRTGKLRTITPDKNGYVPPGTCNALWDYYPSFAAALIFAILFFVLTAVHIWQAVVYKKKFCWVLIVGASWETIALTLRTLSTRYQQNIWVYLIFQIFILLAPLWVNAFDYMVLGRMVHFFIPSHSLFSIPASTLAVCFVSFIIQLVGGSLAGPTSSVSQQMKAIHIYVGDISLQQFFIVVFVGFAMKFQLEMSRRERFGPPLAELKSRWKPLLFTLYTTLALITIRIIFRLVEFSSGTTSSNPLLFHETYFYILEALPMLFAILAFNIIHPGSILVGPESEMPGLRTTLKGCCGKRKAKEHLLNNALEEFSLV